jgi:hypothetical protein
MQSCTVKGDESCQTIYESVQPDLAMIAHSRPKYIETQSGCQQNHNKLEAATLIHKLMYEKEICTDR